jgi:hypothetical protein
LPKSREKLRASHVAVACRAAAEAASVVSSDAIFS